MIKATNNSSHWHSTRKQERDGQIWSQRWKLKKEEGQKKKNKEKNNNNNKNEERKQWKKERPHKGKYDGQRRTNSS